MDLVDDPSSPNIIAIFELPGVKNENITLQIKDKRLIVVGKRVDPYTEALAAAASAATNSEVQSQQDDGPTSKTAETNSTMAKSLNPSNKAVRELRYGSFFRSIPVPEGVKQSEVTAGIQDGMLTVTWPRIPAAARQSVTEMAVDPTNPDSKPVTSSVNGSISTLLGSNGTAPALQ